MDSSGTMIIPAKLIQLCELPPGRSGRHQNNTLARFGPLDIQSRLIQIIQNTTNKSSNIHQSQVPNSPTTGSAFSGLLQEITASSSGSKVGLHVIPAVPLRAIQICNNTRFRGFESPCKPFQAKLVPIFYGFHMLKYVNSSILIAHWSEYVRMICNPDLGSVKKRVLLVGLWSNAAKVIK